MAQDRGNLMVKLQHGVAGMPDRLLLRPDGVCLFIEFKRRGQKPTKIQAYWHARLRDMCQRVVVVRSADEFLKLLTSPT